MCPRVAPIARRRPISWDRSRTDISMTAKTPTAPASKAMLVRERELPKWGNAVEEYLERFERARNAIAGDR